MSEPGTGTPHDDPAVAAIERAGSRSNKRSRIIGFAIGLALVAGAAVAVGRQQGVFADAWANLRAAPVWMIALGLALPLVNLLLASLSFWLLTARYGRVQYREMTELLSAAWVLNYLPLWPGMIGRLTYHKTVNSIAVRDSAKALIWANVLNVLAALSLLVLLAGSAILFDPSGIGPTIVVASPIAALVAFAIYARAKRPEPDPEIWRTIAALGVRLAEHHVWAGRYFVMFGVLGAPISWAGALGIAGITALAIAVPISGNSLGVREWAVGFVATILPASLLAQGGLSLETGLTADLMNRAAELAVAIPAGALGAMIVARRIRRFSSGASASRGPAA